MKFVIMTPRQATGGGIVMHKLCRLLCELGHDARVWVCDIEPSKEYVKKKGIFWCKAMFMRIKFEIKCVIARLMPNAQCTNTEYWDGVNYQPVAGCKRYLWPFVSKETIVIYPQTYYGNVLNATKVVRWLLYYPSIYDDPKSFAENDLFVCYREVFNDWKRNPMGKTLFTPHFNLDLYKQTNFEDRQGSCYIIRKGRYRDDAPKTVDGPIIDNLPEREKVKVFNQCKYAYSYDTQTAYTTIASICGCLSIVVPEPGKNRSDYRGSGESPGYGVAYGDSSEELEYAEKTRHKCIADILEREKKGLNSAREFVEECRRHFDL